MVFPPVGWVMVSLRLPDWPVQSTLKFFLYGVTFIVIALGSLLINWTTDLICDNDRARDFIEKIQGIPLEGWKVTMVSFLCFGGIVVLTRLRKRWNNRPGAQWAASLVELTLCLGIIVVLDFSYRGILFIVFINALRFVPGRRPKFFLLTLCLLAFLLSDVELISTAVPVFSINDYMNFYPESLRLLLYGTRNVLVSVNEILFIIYMSQEVQGWIEENTKTRSLNDQLVRTSKDLAVANVRLEEYARRADESARVRERSRMAGEIHDILGHSLMGIEVGLKACLEIFPSDPSRVRVQMTKIADMARTGVAEVRRIVLEQETEARKSPTIVDSLNQLAAGIRDGVGRQVVLSVEGTAGPLSPVQEEVLYRVAQEAMTNAIAHGDAKNIEVELRFNDQSTELSIRDDGTGGGAFQEGFGLRNMRERAESVGGQALFTQRDRGFLVMVTIPQPRKEVAVP